MAYAGTTEIVRLFGLYAAAYLTLSNGFPSLTVANEPVREPYVITWNVCPTDATN